MQETEAYQRLANVFDIQREYNSLVFRLDGQQVALMDADGGIPNIDIHLHVSGPDSAKVFADITNDFAKVADMFIREIRKEHYNGK